LWAVKGLLFVTKKSSIIPRLSRADAVAEKASILPGIGKRVASPLLWLWFTLIIVLGLAIVSLVNSTITNWLITPHIPGNAGAASPSSISTLPVQRTAQYAGLQVTIIDAQFAPSFPDDPIGPGAASVRLNLHITNPTNMQAAILYYDSARLLIPQRSPVAPTNTNLTASASPGKSQVGWLDFPVSRLLDLKALTLRLGSASLDETMVAIPLTGLFDPRHFAPRSSPQSLDISYTFSGNPLTYHLKRVDVLYSYQGNQAKAGQQFYALNFLVDNPNGAVSPGFGFDYMRLAVNGYNQPPLDSTLPYTFKVGTRAVSGVVVFSAPAHMRAITIVFRTQMGDAQQTYTVNL
jgi:hypothetical protein